MSCSLVQWSQDTINGFLMDESSISLAAEAHEEKRHNVQMMHSELTFDLNHFMTGIKMKYWGWGEERRKGREPWMAAMLIAKQHTSHVETKVGFGATTTAQPKVS